MRSLFVFVAMGFLIFSCGKKNKKGDASAALMKAKTVSVSLNPDAPVLGLAGSGSFEQSFTPTSLKLPIFKVNLCQGTSGCESIYSCGANTVEGCSVELGNIDAFVDTLNAGANEVSEGTYDYIGVQFCPDGDSSGVQNITAKGTVKIQGVDYATHPTAGLTAGTNAQDVSIKIKGGCASFYQMKNSVEISKGTTSQVRLFFDASLYMFGGLTPVNSMLTTYNADSCVGSANAYTCAQVITVVATVDSGTPTAEHYLIANVDTTNGGSANASPTGKVVLYFGSDGNPIGGVENAYRLSGSSVTWGGNKFVGGLGLVPKVVDASTVSFGEPEGSISLADWFKNFKRSTHSGTYTFATSGGGSTEGSYKATKL